MKKSKRIIAALLCATMLFSVVPGNVLTGIAGEDSNSQEQSQRDIFEDVTYSTNFSSAEEWRTYYDNNTLYVETGKNVASHLTGESNLSAFGADAWSENTGIVAGSSSKNAVYAPVFVHPSELTNITSYYQYQNVAIEPHSAEFYYTRNNGTTAAYNNYAVKRSFMEVIYGISPATEEVIYGDDGATQIGTTYTTTLYLAGFNIVNDSGTYKLLTRFFTRTVVDKVYTDGVTENTSSSEVKENTSITNKAFGDLEITGSNPNGETGTVTVKPLLKVTLTYDTSDDAKTLIPQFAIQAKYDVTDADGVAETKEFSLTLTNATTVAENTKKAVGFYAADIWYSYAPVGAFANPTVTFLDDSSFREDVEALDKRIVDLEPFTIEDLDELQNIKSEYDAMDETVKQFVMRINSVIEAIEAFEGGAYFYDNFEGGLNWKIASKITDENHSYYDNLKETNEYSQKAASATGNAEGEAFWGIYTDTADLSNKVLWLRKAFNDKVAAGASAYSRMPSVTAITKEGVLPTDAGITSVKGKMYINKGETANERAFGFAGLAYEYSGEYDWTAVGLNYAGNLYGAYRNSETDGKNQGTYPSSNFLYDGTLTSFATDQWIEFNLEYDFAYGYYLYHVTGLDVNGQTVSWEIQLTNGTELISQVALLHTNYTKPVFDDITVSIFNSDYVEKKIDNLPDASGVTLDDEVQILATLSMFTKLGADEREEITNLEKFEAVYGRYQELVSERDGNLSLEDFITFELGEPGKEYFEAINSAGVAGWIVCENPSVSDGNSSEKVFQVMKNYGGTADAGNNRAVYKLKDVVMNGERMIANYSGKVFLTDDSTATVIYEYTDAEHWGGYQLAIINNSVAYKSVVKNGTGDLKLASKWTTLDLIVGEKVTLPTDGLWVEFNLEYTMLEVLLSVKYSYQGEDYVARTASWGTLSDTCMTKVGLCTDTTSYFDDIRVNFQGTDGYITATNFTETYSQLLRYVPAETYISITDESMLNAMRLEYDAMTLDTKSYMPFVGVRIAYLESLLNAIDETSDVANRDKQLLANRNQVEEGYTEFTFEDDFEKGLSAWMPGYETKLNSGTVTTEYHELFGSNVLKMTGVSVLTPKTTLLPDKPQLVSVSYKIYMEGKPDSFYTMRVYGNFIGDSGSGYGFYSKKDNSAVVRRFFANDTHQNVGDKPSIKMDNVWDVKINYTKSGKYDLIITDSYGTKWELPTAGASLQSLLAIGSFCSASSNNTVYIDDLEVVYREGEYDVDQVNKDITVYYSGNTLNSAGDIVTLSGENLSANVVGVQIAPVANDSDSGERAFVSQERFDSLPAAAGEYSKDPVAHTFDENLAVNVEIIQKTTNSVKIRIPTEFGGNEIDTAVYAVKLTGTGGKSKIVYINNPYIDYTVGSDGEIASPGTEIRVIGKNLSPQKNAEKMKAVLVAEDGNVIETAVTKVQSVYSVSVEIPTGITAGTYELWLHSGMGDHTAWSVPTFIQVADAVRDSWPDDVFNIADYGATGDPYENATPCFVNALTAIAENNGGILYLPKGTYAIEAELYIPENCRIIGEDAASTNISITPYNYAIGDLPEAHFIFKGNVEFSNFNIVSTRCGSVFASYEAVTENVYINNMKYVHDDFFGPVTNGMGHAFKALVDLTQLKQMILAENGGGHVFKINNTLINFQVDNLTLEQEHKETMHNEDGGSKYWNINEFSIGPGWLPAYVANSILENCDFGEGASLGVWGNGVYFQNDYFHDRTANNRELFVADYAPASTKTLVAVEGDETGTKYLHQGTLNRIALKSGQIYIHSGQGVGQTRSIKSYRSVTIDNESYIEVTLDSPFHIKPNRNSKMVIRASRENIFFIDNEYYNGTAGGFYGGAADVIYDNCTFEAVSSIYQRGQFGDVDFYFSFVNCDIKPGAAVGSAFGGDVGFSWEAMSGENATMCFLMRDCEVDAFHNTLRSGGSEYMADVVFQRNEWKNMDYAISMYEHMSATNLNGILMADNSYVNVDSIFDSDGQSVADMFITTSNWSGSKRLVILDNVVSYTVYGDVNGDGVSNLKDATLISYYVIGKIELTDEQKAVGDVSNDGTVNLQDASLIKFYVAGKIDKYPIEEEAQESN